MESSIQFKSDSGVAIITGGSQGIGAACIRRFVQSGWRVATISLPGESFEPMRTGSVLALSGDLVNEQVRQTLVERTLQHYGRIDVVVNNAGVGSYSPPSSLDIHVLKRMLEVNLIAPLRLAQLVIPTMPSVPTWMRHLW